VESRDETHLVCIEGLRGSTDIPFVWGIVQRRFKLTMLEKEIQRF
jgi:hypothetical protein